MELTANRRPFLYFPLRHHFEQAIHVAHRLERYGAGRRMDFETATPEAIADAIAAEIGREVDVPPGRHRRRRPRRGDARRAALEPVGKLTPRLRGVGALPMPGMSALAPRP